MDTTELFPFLFSGNFDHGLRNSGHLQQQPSPQILSHDQIFRAQVGETLVLPCQVANLGTYVLMWKQQKRVLTAGTLVVRKDYRMRLRDDFSLELSELKPDDQGTYACEIDVMGKPISITHKVQSLAQGHYTFAHNIFECYTFGS